MQASAAAGAVSAALGDVRWTETKTRPAPEPKDIRPEDTPRIGVFVCNCGINIGGYLDVPELSAYARSLPNVTYVEDNLFTCSQDTQVNMTKVIEEHNLNRVVVAACTPITHEPLFRETLIDAGLNKYLFEMANIRNQDTWVHMKDHDKATDKAKDLVRMAVARASLLKPLTEKPLTINQRALVIGGGIAGLNAALNLGDQGFETILLEKEPQLGGIGRRVHKTIEGLDVQAYLDRTHRAGQGPRQDPGARQCPGGGVQRLQRQLHHGSVGGARHVRAENRSRHHRGGHRRPRIPPQGISLRGT